MGIIFKKLLPKSFQTTLWGDFIDVIQSLFSLLKSEKILSIFNQWSIIDSNTSEKFDLIHALGFHLDVSAGYTGTDYFLNRELQTISKRIKYKNTRKAYFYTSKIFNLTSNLFLTQTNSGILNNSGITTFFSSSINTANQTLGGVIIDQESDNLLYYNPDSNTYLYDTPKTTGLSELFTDTAEAPTTDLFATTNTNVILTNFTRNLMYSYKYNLSETSSEFLTIDTLSTLENDINQIKKATEVIYYEPDINIIYNKNQTVNVKQYTNYDGTVLAEQKTILLSGIFSNPSFIQFGSGTISNLSGVILGVQAYSYQYPPIVSGVIDSTLINYSVNMNPNITEFDFTIYEKNQFSEFTELAFFDQNSGIILYSTFPKIQWTNSMYNNIKFTITFV